MRTSIKNSGRNHRTGLSHGLPSPKVTIAVSFLCCLSLTIGCEETTEDTASSVGSESPSNRTAAEKAFDELANQALPPFVDGGPDMVTYTLVDTFFEGLATTPDGSLLHYRWDFDGDGRVDWESDQTGSTSHRFEKPGKYTAVFSVTNEQSAVVADSMVKVVVRSGGGETILIPSLKKERSIADEALGRQKTTVRSQADLTDDEAVFLGLSSSALLPANSSSATFRADGNPQSYIIMINGGSETRFWDDMEIAYEVFSNAYGVPDDRIYLLNHDGSDPDGNNPNGIIDGPATKDELQNVVNQLSTIVDEDDLVFLFVTDHGNGYVGPIQIVGNERQNYGYLAGSASVDNGDELDYRESEFKLRALFNGGTYKGGVGMEQWAVVEHRNADIFYRIRYVSHFDNVYFTEDDAVHSDDDVLIESFTDYLAGDLNRDGKITGAEVMDFDGDGNPPYDPATDTFDEDDWGELDRLSDVTGLNTRVPEGYQNSYAILDVGLDNVLDIDLTYDPDNPHINGTDSDGDGLFDSLDVNDDGDWDDWVSIDELLCLYGENISDDELATMLNPLHPEVMVVAMEQCFSGGFLEDLSSPRRVVFTATTQEMVSWGNTFIRNVAAALLNAAVDGSNGDPSNLDTSRWGNGNGVTDMSDIIRFVMDNGNGWEKNSYTDSTGGVLASTVSLDSWGFYGKRIAFQSIENDKWVCADLHEGSNAPLYTNRDYPDVHSIGPWETFGMIETENDKVALRSFATGAYVCAEDAGESRAVANRPWVQGWETFSFYPAGDGVVGIRAEANNRYLNSNSFVAEHADVTDDDLFHLVPVPNTGTWIPPREPYISTDAADRMRYCMADPYNYDDTLELLNVSDCSPEDELDAIQCILDTDCPTDLTESERASYARAIRVCLASNC